MDDSWNVVDLNGEIGQEFDALPIDVQAKFFNLIKLIEDLGLVNIGMPYIKHIEGKIWELRVKAKSGYGRGLYCTVTEKKVVVLRYFIKKSAKTPQNELKLAKRRLKELLNSQKK